MSLATETTTMTTETQLTYDTRFGAVSLREDRLITFPEGLYGFPDCTVFGLTQLPNVEESPLLLLQCVNRPELAFLVADPTVLGMEIAKGDIEEAVRTSKLPAKETQVLVILTMYDHGESYYITANLRAPLLVDSTSRQAKQYILLNKDYSTQHKL